ncbi:hypothetical protein SEA_HARAMBE_3 [Gordonia phage Harambe]|uniref:Uncharacterized protein n=7 Tax=Woesvirus woes TaxID=1982751 RepID=A0A411B2P5_9CAUD|nr:hypothetical protein SEA_HARAMBE_3 [Gordonia phage Harambe]QAX95365.1 hypothetical protein SEA_NEOEVIE_3 [Gordonia phage Neoevie]QBP30283.1 hypothetical protein SEA_JORMUNGANDR_3 [Gordonia phage Jormungandr]QBP30578.1 hypothetical protein SEA_LAHIRIUM_3 [Gordonia phage Lahirium]QDH48251.1 hypothetical protein SEA_LUKER_3 [Gordonia phage Luker]
MPHKRKNMRVEVRVRAEQTDDGYLISVFDRAGLLAKTECFHKTNVARTAAQAASVALGVSEGRIKISPLEYA